MCSSPKSGPLTAAITFDVPVGCFRRGGVNTGFIVELLAMHTLARAISVLARPPQLVVRRVARHAIFGTIFGAVWETGRSSMVASASVLAAPAVSVLVVAVLALLAWRHTTLDQQPGAFPHRRAQVVSGPPSSKSLQFSASHVQPEQQGIPPPVIACHPSSHSSPGRAAVRHRGDGARIFLVAAAPPRRARQRSPAARSATAWTIHHRDARANDRRPAARRPGRYTIRVAVR